MNDAAAVIKIFTATTAVVSTERESAASEFSRETRYSAPSLRSRKIPADK